MDQTQKFVSDFHSITGITVGERRKQLYLLLNETKHLLGGISGGHLLNLSTLQPRNPLEEIFKTETAIYFEKTDSFWELLRSENPAVIRKLFKARGTATFVPSAFQDVSGNQLAEEIFPYISLRVKQKLLTRLGRRLVGNPIKADDYFRAIEKSYGLNLAQRLLPSCSEPLILECVLKDEVRITPGELKIILDRCSASIETILEKLEPSKTRFVFAQKYRSVFIYLALERSSVFMRLYEKFDPMFRLGSKGTANFVREHREALVKNPHKLRKFLKVKELHKCLRADFRTYFENFIPKSIWRLGHLMPDVIDQTVHLKSDWKRTEFIFAAFRKFYGRELWEYLELMGSAELIEKMSPEDRRSWMDFVGSRPNSIPEETWLSYWSNTEEALELLKTKISLTSSIKYRAKLLCAMVTNCKLNRDLNALVDVCRYFYERHRNEGGFVYDEFLRTVLYSFDLLKLDGSQWEIMLKILKVFKVNFKIQCYGQSIEETYIHYRLLKGYPIKDDLKLWATESPGRYMICANAPEYSKYCLLEFNDLVHLGDLDETGDMYFSYLFSIRDWNRTHPRNCISPFINPSAIQQIKKDLARDKYASTGELFAFYCLTYDFERAQREDFLRLLFGREEAFYEKSETVKWLLKHQPQLLLDYVEVLLPLEDNRDKYRNYAHLNLPQLIFKRCREIVKDQEHISGGDVNSEKYQERMKAAVALLARTGTPTEVLEAFEAYTPSESCVADRSTDQGRVAWLIQDAFMDSIRSLNAPASLLGCVSKFCKGEYTIIGRKPLAYLAHNTPEDKLRPFLDSLTAQEESAAISLAIQSLKTHSVQETLSKLVRSKKKPLIRKRLFRVALKCFRKNPNDSAWSLMKANLTAVCDGDPPELFGLLIANQRLVPRSYLARYISFAVLDVSKKLPDQNDPHVEEGKVRLLKSVPPDVISEFPESFLREIIEECLAKSSTKSVEFQETVRTFVCAALIHHESETTREELMRTTVAVLKNNKPLTGFVREFCAEFLLKNCSDANILDRFLSVCTDSFSKYQIFDEYLSMRFTAIYLRAISEKMDVLRIAEEVTGFCDELYFECCAIVPIFHEVLDFFMQYYFYLDPEDSSIENQLLFVKSVLKSKRTVGGSMLAIFLLPKGSMGNIFESKLDAVIESIARDATSEVRVYLNNYLNNRSDED